MKNCVIYNKKTNQYYNFVLRQWTKHLTGACLVSWAKALAISPSLDNVVIKRTEFENCNENNVVDIVMGI